MVAELENLRREASETALRFKIVTLRIPYLSDKKNGGDVDISYDHRNLLVASSPTDIHQDKTASAITGAEQMLADLKAPQLLDNRFVSPA